MSQPNHDPIVDVDPLLAFTTETARKSGDSSHDSPSDAMDTRLAELEQSIDQSKQHLSDLRAEVATLVRVVADIKQRMSRRAPPSPPIAPVARAGWQQAASAVAGIAIGVAIGALLLTAG
ncbi:MAG TPA: hypothetical protein VEC39_17365 [Vicinamibacterales bacterium]|nr:hypothetical protein [Vicinamibacterales bacterium]